MAQKGPLALRLWRWKKAFLDEGVRIDDLAFLARHRATLRELSVTGDEILDVAEVNELASLTALSIDAPAGGTGPVKLAQLPNLRRLRVWNGGDGARRLEIDWSGAERLEEVSVESADDKDLAAIAALPGLKTLSLDNPESIPASFRSHHLRELEITGLDAWPDAFDDLPLVESLSIVDCRNLSDLTVFAPAGALAELSVDRVPGLRSLAGVSFRPDAEVDLIDCPDLADIGTLDPSRADVTVDGCPLLRLP